MAFTATQLVTSSYYLSNIVSRDLETISGDQITEGIRLLNVLLDMKSSDIRYIPYFERYTFNLVVDQEEYFIPGLVDIQLLTFNIATVRYSMINMGRVDYFGQSRLLNISSLPYQYHVEREKDGSRIYLYFKPNQAYVAQLSGKFALTNVVAATDLTTVYEQFYIEYLRYSLAQMLCLEYDMEFPAPKLEMLREYESKVEDTSPPDFTMQKLSTLQRRTGFSYAQANIGRGWTVPY